MEENANKINSHVLIFLVFKLAEVDSEIILSFAFTKFAGMEVYWQQRCVKYTNC